MSRTSGSLTWHSHLAVLLGKRVLFFFGDFRKRLGLKGMFIGKTFSLLDELFHVIRVELANASVSLLLVAEALVRQESLGVLDTLTRLASLELLGFSENIDWSRYLSLTGHGDK